MRHKETQRAPRWPQDEGQGTPRGALDVPKGGQRAPKGSPRELRWRPKRARERKTRTEEIIVFPRENHDLGTSVGLMLGTRDLIGGEVGELAPKLAS